MRVSLPAMCCQVAPPSSERYSPEPFSMLLPTMYMRWPLVCMAIATATRPSKGGILICVQVMPLVGGLEDLRRLGPRLTAAAAAATTATAVVCALRGGQHHAGHVVGVLQVARAVVVGGLEDVGPGLAAIGGAVNTAALAGGIAEGGDDHQVRDSVGSTRMLSIFTVSSRPMCFQVLPASVDFHMPLPRLPLMGSPAPA